MDRLLRTIDDDSRKQVNRLERRIEENKDFVMSWVHEIKTPIAAGTMLIAAGKEKTKEELLDKMEDELAVISHYVEQALYFSRIDSFSNDYLIDAYPLREIVNASLKKHAKLSIGKKIRVATVGLDHRVLTDKKWLGFIVDQIISNALKYAYPGSTIKVIGRRTESAMELLISDEGRGIDGGDIGRVFEKGFTGSTGRKERRSTGMGLYLSRKLAEKLGHRLSLSSVKGKGTKVKIQIADHVDYVSLAKQKRKVTKM
jgi:signal transduction histidine kinase